MKTILTLSSLLIIISVFTSCGGKKDFDNDDRLLISALESANGDFSFKPMQRADSNYVLSFTPAIYTYKGEPYTGRIAAYNDKDVLLIDGQLTNGVQNGPWKFYYASGVLMMEGNYTDGHETGFWTSYYTKDKPRIKMYYDKIGFMLMRKEYYDNGQIKNYQNIKCPQFGNRERRIEFTYDGKVDYIDAEREIGALPPEDINMMLRNDALLIEERN